jgi:hypothetical protein
VTKFALLASATESRGDGQLAVKATDFGQHAPVSVDSVALCPFSRFRNKLFACGKAPFGQRFAVLQHR